MNSRYPYIALLAIVSFVPRWGDAADVQSLDAKRTTDADTDTKTDADTCERLFDAIRRVDAARQSDEAISLKKQLLSTYPDCRHRDKVLFSLAEQYRSLQLFDEATAVYLQYLKERDPSDADWISAVQNTVTLLLALARYDEVYCGPLK